MFAVIDCGTTNTRIYLVTEDGTRAASGERKVGVRDTAITGSRETLKAGIESLFQEVLSRSGIPAQEVRFAIASGMITSEIGLIGIPHLAAPCGLRELAEEIKVVRDPAVLNLGIPVYLIRGVRNSYRDASVQNLRNVDFMRGEEVQCIGILEVVKPVLPATVVVFSSHTKFIHIDETGRITHSVTTMSGQIFEALRSSTNVGKSIAAQPQEARGRYSWEQIVDTAYDCVRNAGMVRTMLMPRFMETLMETTGAERELFVDAAIAADDMSALHEFVAQGGAAQDYVLFGHLSRCRIFEYLVRKEYGGGPRFTTVSDKKEIGNITIQGVIAVAKEYIQKGGSQ